MLKAVLISTTFAMAASSVAAQVIWRNYDRAGDHFLVLVDLDAGRALFRLECEDGTSTVNRLVFWFSLEDLDEAWRTALEESEFNEPALDVVLELEVSGIGINIPGRLI